MTSIDNDTHSKGGGVPPDDVVDPTNGFQRLYHSVRRQIEYSLVQVPADCPVRMHYIKPSCGIDLWLEQDTDNDIWTVRGQMDEDTFANFGFRVAQPRRGRMAPVVTAEDVALVREYGRIRAVGRSDEGQQLFEADLRPPATVVRWFFVEVWLPRLRAVWRTGSGGWSFLQGGASVWCRGCRSAGPGAGGHTGTRNADRPGALCGGRRFDALCAGG
jgi:hypothetical protein